MLLANSVDYQKLYTSFHSPISTQDCGEKCAPYNVGRVPFCCDTHHAIPSVSQDEWDYLRRHTNLWHIWSLPDSNEVQKLRSEVPDSQVLIECLGYQCCQRDYRSIICRAFPFFPYISRKGDFLGLSYYWKYAERCWVINHLETVTAEYRLEFITAYEELFTTRPQEKENFRHHSSMVRRIFGRKHRTIPLLHRNGYAYKVSPHTGRLRRVPIDNFPRYGPYLVASELAFPDEVEN